MSPQGRRQGPYSLPQHHPLPCGVHPALCHQEGKRSVRRSQRLAITSVDMNVGYLIWYYLSKIWVSTLPSVLLSFSSFSKPRQRDSHLRWILTQLLWKTSSVWIKWRRTWLLLSVCSKMTSHATSAFVPHQVFVSSQFLSFTPSYVFSLPVSPHITLFLFLTLYSLIIFIIVQHQVSFANICVWSDGWLLSHQNDKMFIHFYSLLLGVNLWVHRLSMRYLKILFNFQ